jgi:hypothetical protein
MHGGRNPRAGRATDKAHPERCGAIDLADDYDDYLKLA